MWGGGACSTCDVPPRRLLRASLVILVPVDGGALAQSANTDANGGGTGPPGDREDAAGASASAASTRGSPPRKTVTGYGYSNHTPTPHPGTPPRHSLGHRDAPAHHASPPAGPVATLPGFEMLGEGGSRVFVEAHPVGSGRGAARPRDRHVRPQGRPRDRAQQPEPARDGPLQHARHARSPGAHGQRPPLHPQSVRADGSRPRGSSRAGKEGSAVLNIDFPEGCT